MDLNVEIAFLLKMKEIEDENDRFNDELGEMALQIAELEAYLSVANETVADLVRTYEPEELL